MLALLKARLETWQIHDRAFALWICRLIPDSCPFARTITWFGHRVVEIPPLCQLNPLFDSLMVLRFRAACLLEESDAAAHS